MVLIYKKSRAEMLADVSQPHLACLAVVLAVSNRHNTHMHTRATLAVSLKCNRQTALQLAGLIPDQWMTESGKKSKSRQEGWQQSASSYQKERQICSYRLPIHLTFGPTSSILVVISLRPSPHLLAVSDNSPGLAAMGGALPSRLNCYWESG